MKIVIEFEGENITSEELFESLQNINGQDCIQMVNMRVDDEYHTPEGILSFRPE